MAAKGVWTTGVCNCLDDCDVCCLACWCPCIQAGRNVEVVTAGSVDCAYSCCLCCAVFNLCGCLYMYKFRKKLRALYDLPAWPCGDCCTYFCCCCCAICQEARELKNRGIDPALGWIDQPHIQLGRDSSGVHRTKHAEAEDFNSTPPSTLRPQSQSMSTK